MVRLDSFYTCSSRQPKYSKTIGGVERWMRLYMYHSDKANRAARNQLPGCSVRAGQSRDPLAESFRAEAEHAIGLLTRI
jgi:hypothetical protein